MVKNNFFTFINNKIMIQYDKIVKQRNGGEEKKAENVIIYAFFSKKCQNWM